MFMRKQRLFVLCLPLGLMACSPPTGSYETKAVCQELRVGLPSYSRHDTQQSRDEGAAYLLLFDALCPLK